MSHPQYSGIKPTRKDYCEFIIATFTNHTQTYIADHHISFSHDAINRYLSTDDVTPDSVWQSVGHLVRRSGNACLIFDDTVLDCQSASKIFQVTASNFFQLNGMLRRSDRLFCAA